MKQRSHHALLVGAVPGAIPPLLGWTAVTGRIDAGGAVLFAILFLWQIPHFLAITLFRKDEYARAGLQVMPNVTGDHAVRHAIVRWTMALVASTVLLVPLGIAHPRLLRAGGRARRALLRHRLRRPRLDDPGHRTQVVSIALRVFDRLLVPHLRRDRHRPAGLILERNERKKRHPKSREPLLVVAALAALLDHKGLRVSYS